MLVRLLKTLVGLNPMGGLGLCLTHIDSIEFSSRMSPVARTLAQEVEELCSRLSNPETEASPASFTSGESSNIRRQV